MVFLDRLVNKTKLGRSIRAVSEDAPTAALMGIDIDKTISRTFVIGGALAGVAGFLFGTAFGVVTAAGKAGVANPGPHGFSEILYAFSSASNNNGSAFAGLSANAPFYNGLLGLAMLVGRFLMIVPILALAGSLAAKKRIGVTAGTFPTTGPLWVGLLVGVILIVGALTYFPSYTLGPIIEHFQMSNDVSFTANQ